MRSVASSSPEPPDAGSFAEYCAAVNAARMRVVLRVLLATVLVAGPAELHLLHHDAAFWQLFRMGGVLATFVLVTLAFRLSATLQRHTAIVCAAMIAVAMGIEAHGLTRIGGLETLYVGIACVTPMMVILFLMPLRRRVWVAALPPIAFYGVFFALRPSAIHHPYAAVPIFHAFLAVCLAVVFGELSYRLTREHYAQRRLLAGETTRLDAAMQARTAEVLELARNLVSLQETERTRLARELHDELGQQLTGARLEAGALAAETREALGSETPAARRATGIEARIAVAQQTVKDVVFSLRPPALDDFDLATALHILVERYRQPNGLIVDYENRLDGTPLTDTQATTVFRVLQEALTNVTRHAAATRAEVHIAPENGRVVLVVADDGRGMPASPPGLGFGLRGMRERLRLVGGEVTLDAGPRGGVVLRATFPIDVARQTQPPPVEESRHDL